MGEPTRPATDELGGHAWAVHSLARWRWLAAASLVLVTLVLGVAPALEVGRDWRRVQASYNRAARERGVAAIDVHVRQVWIPEVTRADRCGTCHLGAAGEHPLADVPLFKAHPRIPHEPGEQGCTYCHGGQGTATVADDAHGTDGLWPRPRLPLTEIQAGCGTCHAGFTVPLPENLEGVDDARAAFGCEKCHGRAGSNAPDLSSVALRGIPEDWAQRHTGLAMPEDGIKPLSEADDETRALLRDWLATLIGAPRLARGKMIFFSRGCLGCHKRGAVGGDVGPELTAIGDRDPRGLAPDGNSGPMTLPTWMRQHLLDPQAVVPGSKMPPVVVADLDRPTDLDDLVTYLLSLRSDPVPDRLLPASSIAVARGFQRDFPVSGRGLFVTFCSACHGSDGGGRELKTLGVTPPMIGTRGFLAMVTPRFLRAIVTTGRRGRIMPAFAPSDSGLHEAERQRIVDYLWSLRVPPRALEAPEQPPDAAHGKQVYEERCAGCHTPASGAPVFGRPLLVPGALALFSDQDLWGLLMNGWVEEGMPAFAYVDSADLHDLMAFLRSSGLRPAAGAATLPGEPLRASSAHAFRGRALWVAKCADCHGQGGQGGKGPWLNSGPYLAGAQDAYLALRIRNHEGATARQAIGVLSDDEVSALLGHLRSWSGDVAPPDAPAPDPAAVARGRALFTPRCVECHGADGGGGKAPSLAAKEMHQAMPPAMMVMTILEGRKGTPMPSWRTSEKLPVSMRDAFDLVDYVRSLGSPSPSAGLSGGNQ